MNARETNHAMLRAADKAERAYEKLLKAKNRQAHPLVIAGLTAAYAQYNEKVGALWDAWNDSLLKERLARIYC